MAEQIIYPGSGGLNKDASYNVMPQGDYPYALNCIRDESGEYGVITNAKGNERVTFTLPESGICQVVGFAEDIEDQAGIFLLYNSNDYHCIIRYYAIENTVEYILYEEAELNFHVGSFLHVDIIGSGDEKLLFWTGDGVNPPRKINISEAYSYTTQTTTT